MKKLLVVLLSLTMVAGESYAISSSKKKKLINKGKGIGESLTKGISGSAQAGKKVGEDSYKALDKNSGQTKDDSQKGSTTAKVIQVGALGVAIPAAVQCAGQDYVACGIAGVMFGFASQAGKSSRSFAGAADHAGNNQCTYSSNATGNCTGSNPYTAALTPGVINEGKLQNDEAKVLENLSKGGFTVDVDSGKIKGPNGEMDLNDPASLEAGLGSEAYAKVMSQLGDIEKNAKAKVDQLKFGNAGGFDDGGGGAGSIAPVAYGQDGAEGGGGGYAKNSERTPATAKGLTKNFNGEPIGVAADSIFAMMSRRYQLKNTQKTFFGPVPDVQ